MEMIGLEKEIKEEKAIFESAILTAKTWVIFHFFYYLNNISTF